jgi:thiosulfate dehydrogenase
MKQRQDRLDRIARAISQLTNLLTYLLVAIMLIPLSFFYGEDVTRAIKNGITAKRKPIAVVSQMPEEAFWKAPDPNKVSDEALKSQIMYGRELISHTAKYFGPIGTIRPITNGMNCQNCHLEAGTKIFGNNYSAVASTYPKFRPRSGTVEDIYKRVNDCFERSLNGEPLDTMSKEMQAIKSYIMFLGSGLAKGIKPDGAGLKDLAFLDREADPSKGKKVYDMKCVSCHMPGGQGQKTPEGSEYLYPPLWGEASYNDGAGLYRLSNFAKYVKYNMPQGVSHIKPNLTDEEAWDVAAYVNSQARPHINVPADWPDLTKKPVDHPFGPYADSFSEKQHKYGPFKPMIQGQKISSPTVMK